jgi:hypothetical protein
MAKETWYECDVINGVSNLESVNRRREEWINEVYYSRSLMDIGKALGCDFRFDVPVTRKRVVRRSGG